MTNAKAIISIWTIPNRPTSPWTKSSEPIKLRKNAIDIFSVQLHLSSLPQQGWFVSKLVICSRLPKSQWGDYRANIKESLNWTERRNQHPKKLPTEFDKPILISFQQEKRRFDWKRIRKKLHQAVEYSFINFIAHGWRRSSIQFRSRERFGHLGYEQLRTILHSAAPCQPLDVQKDQASMGRGHG